MAEYDLPAVVDKVCEVSNNEKVWYIGHSQGTLIAFAALSENVDNISSKIHGVIALAPVLSLKYVKGPWIGLCSMIGKMITG